MNRIGTIALPVIVSSLVATLYACGPSSGGPGPTADVCQPTPDAHTESCWINDQESLAVRDANDLERLCRTECSKLSDLSIADVEGLRDLSFLGGISQISRLTITQQPRLKSLKGLENVGSLTEILHLGGLPKLEDTSALENTVSSLELGLIIEGNDSLTNLDGLEGLNAIGTSNQADVPLQIADNQRLEDVSALNSVERIPHGRVTIRDNPKLKAIDGLGKVTEFETLQIYDNETLNDITALYGVETISNDLDISDNPKLPQCQADKIANEAEVMGTTTLSGNGSGECR